MPTCNQSGRLVNQFWVLRVLTSISGLGRDDEALGAVRAFIAEGGYGPGERLPAERELMGSLGMTRTTLRRALDALEREGVIWRHVGKGTFVAAPVPDGADIAVAIAQQTTPVKMVRARLCIEPAIAREAAVNASAEAFGKIVRAGDAAETAATWDDYEAADDRFHRAIAEATDNVVLVSLFDALNRTKRAVAWSNVVRTSTRPPEGYASFVEHAAVLAAIEARDPIGAHDAMRRHIGSVSSRLFAEG